MKKVAFYTLGCKVNQYETEAVTELFEQQGYEEVGFEDKADVYIINTCTVTSLSDRKSRQMIRRAKKNNGDAVVIVMGCYAQMAPDEVMDIPEVDLVIGTKDRKKIFDYLKELENGSGRLNFVENIMAAREFEDLEIGTYKERTRAFIKIQEGCSQFCAYCIIPYARGPIRSRQPRDVINEVRKLAESGFKEIVLTGIHISSYGRDLRNTSLAAILRDIHGIDGIERIRLGSIEPTVVNEEFIEAVKPLNKLCPHFHLSLQSGCDETLKRMNRKYTTEEYGKVVKLLRENIPDTALTTDVMVGFPGETDAEFEATYSFLEEISFAKMHIFKFSPRKGTPAATFEGQVEPGKKEERSNRLIMLSERNSLKFNQGYLGKEVEVLFEQEVKDRKGWMEGLTKNYIRVMCEGDNKLTDKIAIVRVEDAFEDYTSGRLV